MEISIARNPHMDAQDQNKLVDHLTAEQRKLKGLDSDDKLDKAGVAKLKKMLSEHSRLVKVK